MPDIPRPRPRPRPRTESELQLLQELIEVCMILMSLAQWYVYHGSFVLHNDLERRVEALCNSNVVAVSTFARIHMRTFTLHFRALQLPRVRRRYITAAVDILFGELYRFCELQSLQVWQEISLRFREISTRIQVTEPCELENPQV